METTKTHAPGLERLLKLIRITPTSEQFVKDIQKFPHWYLQNDYLKRQTKQYFINLFNEFKK